MADIKSAVLVQLVITVMEVFLKIIHCSRMKLHHFKSCYTMMIWNFATHWDPTEKKHKIGMCIRMYYVVIIRVTALIITMPHNTWLPIINCIFLIVNGFSMVVNILF